MARHAYLLLVHKNPRQVARLVRLLDFPGNDIYIHVDRKARGFHPSLFAVNHAALHFIEPRLSVNWGGVSGMKSELALLKAAVANGPYDYYHLLSGQDLPIKTQQEIHAFFEANKGKEFLNLWTIDDSARSRHELITLFPEGEGKFYLHAINKAFKKIQKLAGYKRRPTAEIKFGSNWFSITHALAAYTLQQERWLLDTFGHTNNCDELFLSTVVWNSPFREKLYVPGESAHTESNLSFMRYIDWTRPGCVRHPWTFRKGDFNKLMNVPHLWARKFDEKVDDEIIDLVYNEIKRRQQ